MAFRYAHLLFRADTAKYGDVFEYHSDNGGEFNSRDYTKMILEEGAMQTFSTAYAPEAVGTPRQYSRKAEACAFFTQCYRRRLGVCVVREFARHRIRRVQMVGVARDHLATRPRAQPQLQFRPSPMEFYSFQVFTPQGGAT